MQAKSITATVSGAKRWLALVLTAVFGAAVPLTVAGETVADKVDFNFQIRPILADRCFKCHGPDEKARKAKLRLDLQESAYSIRNPQKNTRAIVPSHPEQSELIRRITTKDEDDRMPPAASNLVLSDADKELLRRWIAQGAE